MTPIEGSKKCKYCGHPAHCTGPVGTENRFHNSGCPEGDLTLSPGDAMAEWERGHRYGFDDNYIAPHRRQYYSKSFILGWYAGKMEIDFLVDVAAEFRCFE